MDNLENNLRAIEFYVFNADYDKQIELHNIYCKRTHQNYKLIYSNSSSFITNLYKDRLEQLLLDMWGVNYCHDEKYIKLDSKLHLISFNDPFEYIDIDDIAVDIFNNPNPYKVELFDFLY